MTHEAGIFRNKLATEGNFTTVSNSWIRSSGLSPAANYLWIYLLSHKVGYELRDSQILAETGFGPKGLRSSRKELVDNGWLRLERKKNADGSLGTYAYFLQEPRVPMGTVDVGTVEMGTVPEGSDLIRTITKKTNNKKTITKRVPQSADDYEPSEKLISEFAERWPGLSLERELIKFKNNHEAKGSKFKDWDRAFVNWLERAVEWSPEAKRLRAWKQYEQQMEEENPDAW